MVGLITPPSSEDSSTDSLSGCLIDSVIDTFETTETIFDDEVLMGLMGSEEIDVLEADCAASKVSCSIYEILVWVCLRFLEADLTCSSIEGRDAFTSHTVIVTPVAFSRSETRLHLDALRQKTNRLTDRNVSFSHGRTHNAVRKPMK